MDVVGIYWLLTILVSLLASLAQNDHFNNFDRIT